MKKLYVERKWRIKKGCGIEMLFLTDKKYRRFFEEFLQFDTYLEVRILHNEKGFMFSKYASNFEELSQIFYRYNTKDFNMYISSNCRDTKSRKDADIKWRRTFYFDIESTDKPKPLFTDPIYRQNLRVIIKFIIDEMKTRYGFSHAAIIKSGRGVHLHFRIKKIDSKETKGQFKKWFKNIQDELSLMKPMVNEQGLPIDTSSIKFSDSVYNVGRICSLPGSYHTKYPEYPLREIIYLADKIVENDLEEVFKKMNIQDDFPISHKPRGDARPDVKYTNETILKSPEMHILQYSNLPEGERHNRLIFALKLLVRDHKIDPRIVQKELFALGYNDTIDNPGDDAFYSESILLNWAFDNCSWALKNNYGLPYLPYEVKKMILDIKKPPLKVNNKIISISNKAEFYGIEDRQLYSFKDIIRYVKDINKELNPTEAIVGVENDRELKVEKKKTFYPKAMYKIIEKNIVNKDLWNYLNADLINNKILMERLPFVQYWKDEKNA